MSENNVTTVTELPKPSLKDRVLTKTNLKRAAIIGGVLGGAVYLKRRFNANGSVSADLHVDNDETNNDN